MSNDIRTALTIVWLIISILLILIILSFCLLPGDVIKSVSGACQVQHPDEEACTMCGMTSAFLAISDHHLDHATNLNRWSVPLYALIVVNELIAAIYFAGRLRNKLGEITFPVDNQCP